MSKPGPIPTEYTAIMTGEPFLHFELKIVAQMRRKGLSNSEIRELVKADNSFQYKTSKSIGRVLKAVLRRLDVLNDRLVELCAHEIYLPAGLLRFLRLPKQTSCSLSFSKRSIGKNVH